ncbi:GPW / gp25 family protein [Leptolyngbya sp. NIES-3755]|nr:GPW / gp25 family protein [Leptolyngbya sp. NIES-3755]
MSDLPQTMTEQAFLGKGWSFPICINVQGNVQLSSGDRSIEESIWLILSTNVGERVGRPEFGSTLSELTFAPLNSDTLVLMCVAVEEALEQWEPRIEIENVQAEPDPINGRVDILIDYSVLENYEPRSLVYPFYLQGEQDEGEDLETEGMGGFQALQDW